MNIKVIADLHNEVEQLDSFKNQLESTDILIMAGDLLEPEIGQPLEKGKKIIEDLSKGVDHLLVIPGNIGPKEFKDWLVKQPISIHGRGKKIGNVGFFGFGGAATPFDTAYEPNEDEIRKGLEKSHEDIRNSSKKIMVVHNPPEGTKLDKIEDGGHVGSIEVRKAIERYKPDLVICAHVHESSGTDNISESVVYYPGPLFEGKFGVVDSEKVNIRTVSLE